MFDKKLIVLITDDESIGCKFSQWLEEFDFQKYSCSDVSTVANKLKDANAIFLDFDSYLLSSNQDELPQDLSFSKEDKGKKATPVIFISKHVQGVRASSGKIRGDAGQADTKTQEEINNVLFAYCELKRKGYGVHFLPFPIVLIDESHYKQSLIDFCRSIKPIDIPESDQLVEIGSFVGKLENGAEAHPLLVTLQPGMWNMIGELFTAQSSRTSVLIIGESGVGKELVAQMVHALDKVRCQRLCVSVNCSAIPQRLIETELFGYEPGAFTGATEDRDRNGRIKPRIGKIEMADGGTLFLDEIGDLSLDAQARLLRFLQEGKFYRVGPIAADERADKKEVEVDVRVVTATNKDLVEEIHAGNFREDLYYRLCKNIIRVPPLRERLEDLEPLVDYLLQVRHLANEMSEVEKVSKAALDKLRAYDFPGNVRELEKILFDAAIKAQTTDKVIHAEHIGFEHGVDYPTAFKQNSVFAVAKRNTNAEPEYLLGLSSWQADGKPVYNFVGGRKRQAERYIQAMIRKMKAELDLEYEVDYDLEDLGKVEFEQLSKKDRIWKDYQAQVYFVHFLNGQKEMAERLNSNDVAWVTLDQIERGASIEIDGREAKISLTVRRVNRELQRLKTGGLEQLPHSFLAS